MAYVARRSHFQHQRSRCSQSGHVPHEYDSYSTFFRGRRRCFALRQHHARAHRQPANKAYGPSRIGLLHQQQSQHHEPRRCGHRSIRLAHPPEQLDERADLPWPVPRPQSCRLACGECTAGACAAKQHPGRPAPPLEQPGPAAARDITHAAQGRALRQRGPTHHPRPAQSAAAEREPQFEAVIRRRRRAGTE